MSNAVAGALPLFQSLHVGQSAERRLKGKILSRRGEAINLPQDHARCRDGGKLRFERR